MEIKELDNFIAEHLKAMERDYTQEYLFEYEKKIMNEIANAEKFRDRIEELEWK